MGLKSLMQHLAAQERGSAQITGLKSSVNILNLFKSSSRVQSKPQKIC